jgi:hypothetical protein
LEGSLLPGRIARLLKVNQSLDGAEERGRNSMNCGPSDAAQ